MAAKTVKVKVEDQKNSSSAVMKHGKFYERRVSVNLGEAKEVCLIASWVWDDINGITNIKFRSNDYSIEQVKNFKKIKANIKWKCEMTLLQQYIKNTPQFESVVPDLKDWWIGQSLTFENIVNENDNIPNKKNLPIDYPKHLWDQIISLELKKADKTVEIEIEFEFEMVGPTSKFCAPELFLNELWSEVKIHCQGRTFPCHNSILF